MLYSVNGNMFSHLTVLGFIIFSLWYSLELSKLIQIVMFLTCIWEVSGCLVQISAVTLDV
jgi:hypothetical protein